MARDQYGYMAWALDDPELGPILRKAAQDGWDANKLKGAVFATNWFRKHGIANVANELKKTADAYMVPLSKMAIRDWAYKVVTGQVQTGEFENTMRTQAKGLWGDFGGALDRGFSVREITDSYVQKIATELEVAPETIDITDAKWQKLLVRRDPDTNKMVNPSLSEVVTQIRTDKTYGWDHTQAARNQAAEFAAELLRKMGRTA